MVAVLRDLMVRRVPHYFGTYIAGAWVTIELISWVVDRYILSDHIIDFTVLLLLLLAPAVLSQAARFSVQRCCSVDERLGIASALSPIV